jgi:hypothetical protein
VRIVLRFVPRCWYHEVVAFIGEDMSFEPVQSPERFLVGRLQLRVNVMGGSLRDTTFGLCQKLAMSTHLAWASSQVHGHPSPRNAFDPPRALVGTRKDVPSPNVHCQCHQRVLPSAPTAEGLFARCAKETQGMSREQVAALNKWLQ